MADPIINDPLQAIVGVKASVVVASLFGGVVSAMLSSSSILQRTDTTVDGCITSIYLTPFAIAYVAPHFATVSTRSSSTHPPSCAGCSGCRSRKVFATSDGTSSADRWKSSGAPRRRLETPIYRRL
ncbi:hypothetical protein IC232_08330 [Microvirga sp. BT688]|uniref:hypothetical protein n=1 Tax=Microvirga sp. TaxID=1873136 RepID=UPI001685FD8C|nr:hypothetical protein [Microvirga sp.]MBD2746704.1 hypothetical protein [Microvirga sp.]